MNTIAGYNFYYDGINIDYDTNYSCHGSYGYEEENDEDFYRYNGCDTICRCGEIVNTSIVSIDLSIMAEQLIGHNSKRCEVSIYALTRILKIFNLDDKDLWEIKVSSGYYGDEIGGVYLREDSGLEDDLEPILEQFYSLDADERMKLALILEYGYPPEQEYTYSLEHVDINTIEIPNQNHFSKCGLSNPYNFAQKENVDQYGLCIVRSENPQLKSILMDGYHRLAEAKRIGMTSVYQVIVAREKSLP